MNHIPAHVTHIQQERNLTVITFDAYGTALTMMGLGLNVAANVGDAVLLGVKATNIALAKGLQGTVSISNRLECDVAEVESGTLFCNVGLRFGPTLLECITLQSAVERLSLEPGDKVTALIKASELSILEVRT